LSFNVSKKTPFGSVQVGLPRLSEEEVGLPSGMVEWIFVEFGMEIMPLELSPQ
jgi:hypothetical protein